MIEVKLERLAIDPISESPVIILRAVGDDRLLPIWVGFSEATAIALELESVKTPRPMTHDLATHLIARLGGELRWALIHDLKENTFYAQLNIETLSGPVEVDARPSDAIAIATRAKCPIYVAEKILDLAKTYSPAPDTESDIDGDEFKKWLEKARPSDFGDAP